MPKYFSFFILVFLLTNVLNADFIKENGVVTDNITKLEWQDNYSDNNEYIKLTTWQDAISYCENLNLNGKGWRLPNITELGSLIDDTKFHPSINETFEFTSSSKYWSSTSNFYSHLTWTVAFGSGMVTGIDYKWDFDHYVRCIREAE